MSKKKPTLPTLRSSAAEYLSFVAVTGGAQASIKMRYEDENIWLTQKMMATLYDVSVPAINQHLKRIFADSELDEAAVVKHYLITASDGKTYRVKHYSLQDAGKVSAELARNHAETEFEQYRIVQDHLFESDFDRLLNQAASLPAPDDAKE